MAVRTEKKSEALTMKAPTTSPKTVSFWARWSPAILSFYLLTAIIILIGICVNILFLDPRITSLRKNHVDDLSLIAATWLHLVIFAATYITGLYQFIRYYRSVKFDSEDFDGLDTKGQVGMIVGFMRQKPRAVKRAVNQDSAIEEKVTIFLMQPSKKAFAQCLVGVGNASLDSLDRRVISGLVGSLAAIALTWVLMGQLVYLCYLGSTLGSTLSVASLVLLVLAWVMQLFYMVAIYVEGKYCGWKWKMRRVARHLKKTILRGDLESTCEKKGGKEMRLKTWIEEFLKEESDTPQEAKDRLENTIQPILDAVVV